MNATTSRPRQVMLGILLGSMLSMSMPQPAEAQWTVYDPANHATALEKKIEDWLHWTQELQDNIRKIELLVKQWTTMKDVLRNAEKLVTDLTAFGGHARRFLESAPRLRGWRVEQVAIATEHSRATRQACERAGFIAQDLRDLTEGL